MKLKNLSEAWYDRNIDLRNKKLLRLPSDLPEKVDGYFACIDNRLTSLKGCPKEVGGNFLCTSNNLTSLEYCPKIVHHSFICSNNEINTLKDIHRYIEKVGWFTCRMNPIESCILGLMLIEFVGSCTTELGDGKDVDAILNKWKNQGRKGVLGAQRELLDLGYEELAQL
jgi:hypothetical protein